MIVVSEAVTLAAAEISTSPDLTFGHHRLWRQTQTHYRVPHFDVHRACEARDLSFACFQTSELGGSDKVTGRPSTTRKW